MKKRKKTLSTKELLRNMELLFGRIFGRQISYICGTAIELRATDRATFDPIEAKAKRIMVSEYGLLAVKIIAKFVPIIGGTEPAALFKQKHPDYKRHDITLRLYTDLLALTIYRERKTVLSLRRYEAILDSLKKSGVFKEMAEEIDSTPL